MRKLVSVILAVASIVCTTSSLAASSTGALASDSRNDITVMETDQASKTTMPAFKGGDRIKFDVSTLTNGNFLSIISYKYNKPEDLSDATIQYIDQYTISQDTQTVEYIVRDNTEDGIYKLSFSGNDESEIVDFYYKVGNPVVAMMPNGNLNYWNMKKHTIGGTEYYAVGYVAKAVIGSNDVSFTDLGIKNFGFKFTVDGKEVTATLTQEQFDAIGKAQGYFETAGKVAFIYGVTMYGIDTVENADAIKAEVHIQE